MCKKRKRSEFEWEEENLAETSEATVHENNKRIIEFLSDKCNEAALRIIKCSKPRGDKIKISSEPFECSLQDWLLAKSPMDGKLLHRHNFLEPLKTLVESVNFMRAGVGDFVFEASDVVVILTSGSPRLKLLPNITLVSGPRLSCMTCIRKIVRIWFQKHSFQVEMNTDLVYFCHCLVNVHSYKNKGVGRILTLHPLFYGEEERGLLFGMILTYTRQFSPTVRGIVMFEQTLLMQ